MKKRIGLTMGLAAILCVSASAAYSASLTVPMYAASSQGAGKPIGVVNISETRQGLVFKPQLTDLPPGVHGFHIHDHPSCDDAAMAAGGHWDPKGTQRHAGPHGDGHLGDLPALHVSAKGNANTLVQAPRIKSLKEISGHALMVHEGGDNYSDKPKPLGGGGKRLACGVIPAVTN